MAATRSAFPIDRCPGGSTAGALLPVVLSVLEHPATEEKHVKSDEEIIAMRVLAHFARPAPNAEEHPFPELTQREREVLDAIARGEANPDIARRLQISAKTVKNYVSAIFAKMQVVDRSQAIVRARDAGLGIGPRTQ